MNLVIDLLLIVYVLVSLLLVLVVLMQRPRSEGLGTAFASGMVEQYIGPATNVLVRFTTWMGGAFFILSILLAILYSHRANTRSKIAERLLSVPALKASASPRPASAVAPLPPIAPAIPGATVAPVAPPSSALFAPLPPAALSPAPALSAPATSPAPAPAAVIPPASPAAASPAASPAH